MIAPGQEMRAFYDSHIERNGRDDLPTSHKVTLKYRDSSGHEYTGTSVIDINAMRGTRSVTVKTIHDIGKSLEEIQKTLSSASVMGRHGTLEVEASVELRDEQERLAREKAEAMSNYKQFVRGVLPDVADPDEVNKSESNGTDTDESGASA